MFPIGNNVVIRRRPIRDTIGSFILPDCAKEHDEIGKVIAVGPGTMTKLGVLAPMQVAEGDVVAFKMFAGRDQDLPEEIVIIPESDILCIIGS